MSIETYKEAMLRGNVNINFGQKVDHGEMADQLKLARPQGKSEEFEVGVKYAAKWIHDVAVEMDRLDQITE